MLEYVVQRPLGPKFLQRGTQIGNIADNQAVLMRKCVPCKMSDGAQQ